MQKSINQIVKDNLELNTEFSKTRTLTHEDLINEKIDLNSYVGIAWTNNNRKYFAIGKIQAINEKTAKVKLEKPNSYGNNGIGVKFNVRIVKTTLYNRLFICKTLDDLDRLVKGLVETEEIINNYVSGKIGEFWEEKIANSIKEELK